MKRDPRIRPIAGDVVTKGTGSRFLQRTVTASTDITVSFVLKNSVIVHTTPIKRWWSWAADAKVLKAA